MCRLAEAEGKVGIMSEVMDGSCKEHAAPPGLTRAVQMLAAVNFSGKEIEKVLSFSSLLK